MTSSADIFDDESLDQRISITQRGSAYFAHRLAELDDDQFDAPTLLPGWSRRHLVAHLGFNAKALCRLMDWAATGVESPMYASPEQRADEIDEGATWSPGALRQFFRRTSGDLILKWGQLPKQAWTAPLRTAQGRLVPATETVWLRAREVWIHAVDLDTTGRFADFPEPVTSSLLGDIVAVWRRKGTGRGLILAVDKRPPIEVEPGSPHLLTVSGPPSAVTRWAAGRGAVDVGFTGSSDHLPPPWL